MTVHTFSVNLPFGGQTSATANTGDLICPCWVVLSVNITSPYCLQLNVTSLVHPHTIVEQLCNTLAKCVVRIGWPFLQLNIQCTTSLRMTAMLLKKCAKGNSSRVKYLIVLDNVY